MKGAPTARELIDQQGADAHYVFSVCMGAAMYSHLVWKSSIDTQVPIHAEEGLDAPFPVPLSRFVEALCNTWKNLPHNLLHPSAVWASERGRRSAPATHFIRAMIGVLMKASTFARLFLWKAVRSAS